MQANMKFMDVLNTVVQLKSLVIPLYLFIHLINRIPNLLIDFFVWKKVKICKTFFFFSL